MVTVQRAGRNFVEAAPNPTVRDGMQGIPVRGARTSAAVSEPVWFVSREEPQAHSKMASTPSQEDKKRAFLAQFDEESSLEGNPVPKSPTGSVAAADAGADAPPTTAKKPESNNNDDVLALEEFSDCDSPAREKTPDVDAFAVDNAASRRGDAVEHGDAAAAAPIAEVPTAGAADGRAAAPDDDATADASAEDPAAPVDEKKKKRSWFSKFGSSKANKPVAAAPPVVAAKKGPRTVVVAPRAVTVAPRAGEA